MSPGRGWSRPLGETARSTAGTAPHRVIRRYRPRRSEEHTSELQSQSNLVCRLLLEKKKKSTTPQYRTGLRDRTYRPGLLLRRTSSYIACTSVTSTGACPINTCPTI